MKTPIVSIIIPTLNRAHLIGETLNSVLAQTYTNWECIVVDDGSTDDTNNMLKEYCKMDTRFQFHLRPNNRLKGANTCRNYGFEKAQGEFIQWFDSDDLMGPDLLKLQLQNLQNSKKLISFCNFSFFRDSNEIGTIKGFNSFNELTSGEKLLTEFVSGQMVLNTQIALFHKSIVENISFNESLHRAQDLDFIFRVLTKTVNEFVILNQNMVNIRRHDQSITDNFKNRDIKLIKSEIFVRKMIWQKLLTNNYQNNSIQGALKMYLKSLKYLLYAKKYTIFFSNIKSIFKSVNIKFKIALLKLSFLGLFHIFTKKGITAYQKVLVKL